MSASNEFWDKKAEKYAASVISDEATYDRKILETQEFLAQHMRVLEFGCGTGTTAIKHAPYVQHIDAIDTSENMVTIGRQKAAQHDVDNITFTRSTLSEFNASADSYDAVLGLNVIHLIADRQAELLQVARALKPGGVFVSSTGCLGKSWLRFLTLITPLAKLMGLMPDVYILTEDELATEIQAAGFRIERQWHHGKGDISVFIIAIKQ